MITVGIDFGDRRVGIARTDGILATGVGTVIVEGLNDAVEKVSAKVTELKAEKVVVGLPRNMDGTEGFRADRTRRFAAALQEKTGVPVDFYDERLTTMQAYTYMNIADTKSRKRRGIIDTLSAEIILQNYIESKPRT